MIEKEKKFTCTRGGLTISGMQYLPTNFEDNKKYSAIIVSHGFTGNYLSTEQYCRDFAKMGYVSFGFNFCGGGRLDEEDNTKSEGATTDMTIFTEIEDLCAVKDYVKSQPFVNKKELILAGVSQGGFVSGLTAARCGEEISKLIMIFPALCIPDHARRGCLGGASYNPANVPEQINCENTVLGRVFHDGVVGMDPFLELEAYHGPVFILHGLEDKIVNYSYAVRAKESYEEGQCRLQLIRDMGHGMDEGQHKSTVASIQQFLKNRKEVLTIRIIITHEERSVEGECLTSNLYFVGYCETKFFQGIVLPGGCDVQEYCKGVQTKVRAEYTLEGIDKNGEKCFIHIVNQKEEDWKPVIKTDSQALGWLNDAQLTAVLEDGDGGPTVRIFAEDIK